MYMSMNKGTTRSFWPIALFVWACGGMPQPVAVDDLSTPAEEDLRKREEDLRQPQQDLRSVSEDLRQELDLSVPADLRPGCNPDMADTQNDPNNCGACGRVCAPGHRCCQGVCRDPDSDPSHCGACGHSCGGNACCGGLCTNINTPTNCGACGRACAGTEGCCGGACVDRQKDPANCGACGLRCAPGQVCSGGSCYSADGGLPDMSGPGCLDGGKAPPAVCFIGTDSMSGSRYTICRADCMSAWVHHADPGGGRFAFQTICRELGYSRAAQWGGTCGDICGYCEGGRSSCRMNGSEKYDSGGMCGADCLSVTVMWQCVK
jgi:hypothetical protein